MKILHCHIENFGILSDYSIDFLEGVNIVCEENGWGKSTFAAFVRAMFYGLQGERKRSLEENERKRYKPWQGGVFGGQLIFEIGGKQYEISRIFGDKEANDEFELRDCQTNLLSDDYSKNIGQEIFKIDRESFMRTVFIGQKQCETSSTDDINAKIGNLSDHTNDLNNFDSAYGKLTEIINKLTPNRVSGSLAKRREEIASYERVVRDGSSIVESIQVCQGYLEKEQMESDLLKEKIKEVGKIQAEVSKLQAILARKSEWDRLKKNLYHKKEEQLALREKFPGDVPELEAVKEMISVASRMEKIQDSLSVYRLTDENKHELLSGTSNFGRQEIVYSDLQQKIQEAIQLQKLLQEYSVNHMTPEEEERYKQLHEQFSKDTDDINTVINNWNQRNAKKSVIPTNREALAAFKTTIGEKESKNKIFILFIIGILFLAVGLGTYVWKSVIIGAGTSVIGVALIIIGVIMRIKINQKVKDMMPKYEKMKHLLEEDVAFIGKTDRDMTQFLQAHGRQFQELAITNILQEITRESYEYHALKTKKKKMEARVSEEEIMQLRSSISSFLSIYGITSIDSNFLEDLYSLKEKYAKYIELKQKKLRFESYKREYKDLKDSIVNDLSRYKFTPKQSLLSQLCDIRDDIVAYLNCEKNAQEALKELKSFVQETDTKALTKMENADQLPTMESLNQEVLELAEQLERVQNRIRLYNQRLEGLQEQYDEWEENKMKLDELKEVQLEEQTKYHHIVQARLKLEIAKKALTAQYAAPIMNAFEKYYEMITGISASSYRMDANSKITVKEFGKQRDTAAFSSGYRDLIGICLRMALIDAMYQGEAPVVIMDDPFTNLDDEKVSAAREFLNRIGERYQTIYFTCSKSRI